MTIKGRANEMMDKICKSGDYINTTDKALAEKSASDGKLVVVGWKNPEPSKSGHFATLSVGDNRDKGGLVNIGTKKWTGILRSPESAFTKKQRETLEYYILDK